MKNSKNTTEVTVQSGQRSVKSQKHDVNLQKNSSLYFQVGLILCLLATYGLFEMQFQQATSKLYVYNSDNFIDDFPIHDFVIEKKVVEQKQPDQKVVKISAVDPIIKKNDYVIAEPIDMVVDDPTPVIAAPAIATPVKPELPPITAPIGVDFVQNVPVYPGCESASNNKERLACMSEKLGKLIQKKFDADLAANLGLTGIQKIYVQFKIDKSGNVNDIQSRAAYVQLEDEAKRVVNKIPTMTPAMQNNMAVDVIYNLPIVFKVQ